MPGFGKLLPEAIQLGRGFINASDPWLDYRALKALLEAICAERGLVFDRKAAGGDGGGAEPPPYPEKSPLTGEALAAALGEWWCGRVPRGLQLPPRFPNAARG